MVTDASSDLRFLDDVREILELHRAEITLVTLTHRDLSILDFLVTDDEHVGHTLPLAPWRS